MYQALNQSFQFFPAEKSVHQPSESVLGEHQNIDCLQKSVSDLIPLLMSLKPDLTDCLLHNPFVFSDIQLHIF